MLPPAHRPTSLLLPHNLFIWKITAGKIWIRITRMSLMLPPAHRPPSLLLHLLHLNWLFLGRQPGLHFMATLQVLIWAADVFMMRGVSRSILVRILPNLSVSTVRGQELLQVAVAGLEVVLPRDLVHEVLAGLAVFILVLHHGFCLRNDWWFIAITVDKDSTAVLPWPGTRRHAENVPMILPSRRCYRIMLSTIKIMRSE